MAFPRAAILLLVFLPLAFAQDYPNCPLTGEPPKAPTIAPTRCPSASKLSCCTDCYDLNYAIQALGANVTDIVDQASGGMASQLGLPADLDVCGIFYGVETCENLVEQVVCAASCNPDSGNYMTSTASGVNLNVCPGFAQQVYDACGDLTFGGFVVKDLLYTPEDIFQQVINQVIAVAVPNFNSTITTSKCFNGPDVIPKTPLCCDPLNVPDTCPTGSVNTTGAEDVIGRTLNSTYCVDFPFTTDSVPFNKTAMPPAGPPATSPAPAAAPTPSVSPARPPAAAPAPATPAGTPPAPGAPAPSPPSSAGFLAVNAVSTVLLAAVAAVMAAL